MTLLRRVPLLRKTRLKPVSKKRQAQRKDYEMAKAETWSRDKGLCRYCGLGSTCGLGVIDVHHVANQRLYPELRCDPDNMVLLHRRCHDWCHGHPREARKLGLIR